MLHGVWILLFAAFLGSLIETIPLAVLAGLLVHVGVNLVNMHHIRELRKHNEAPVYFATVLGVTGLNLLAGVGIGLGLAVIFSIRRLSVSEVTLEERGEKWHVRIEGTLTFASVPKLNEQLSRIPPGHAVDIDLAVDFIDHAAFESLHGWRENHEKTGGHAVSYTHLTLPTNREV